jgi:hypothetical protein
MARHPTKRTFVKILVSVLFLLSANNSFSDGLRNIASITADNFFDGNYTIETVDVFLARFTPGFSMQFKLSRIDSLAGSSHTIGLGPIINFTPGFYLDTRYSAGFDSSWIISHEAEINLTSETDSSVLSCGVRGAIHPETWFFIPTVSGELIILERLSLFGKVFMSVDNANQIAESFWGEAGWSFSPEVKLRTGFTLSYLDRLGYSALCGIDLHFGKGFLIKYTFSFLANTIRENSNSMDGYGIENVLICDIQF